ncbi:Na+/H+ antiporter NhaC family protein [Lentisphaera marina]|uniref:Na+/H+ antiporter NhaC family protein n=1 Tax=Lentisphaera marina TaxID=1111041 RepID=UPI002366FBE2|nr:Na+/H+ antiporter NhaC family protein [Lentisphaera marina]MDD7985468.1 Na+/H+ antiporter NhaC family protein [Lentisphaera marina]MDD7987403.1 Na+/H+ antiporter NhaC family protein [Lentisphaera marina]
MKKKTFFEAILIVSFLLLAFGLSKYTKPNVAIQEIKLQHEVDEQGQAYYTYKKKKVFLDQAVLWEQSPFTQKGELDELPEEQFLKKIEDEKTSYFQFKKAYHFNFFSLLPALAAIVLCFFTREPIVSLTVGAACGAIMIGSYHFPEYTVEMLAQKSPAKTLVLYLWLLGGLLGIWQRTGASLAFANFMTEKFVKGPRSAKLVAWGLGVVFFQGGTISSVLVGTSVKPVADKENISHEELSYIVDSTSSPIASQLAFNAWPGYVQAFIYVPGVAFLATELDRIDFFFKSVPFCFYAIFAVLGTFMLSIEKPWFTCKRLKEAKKRSRETGELDAPNSEPLAVDELSNVDMPKGYNPHVIEFLLPLFTLLGVAIGTYVIYDSPDILLAFGLAFALSITMAVFKGMEIQETIKAAVSGMKGVLGGSIVLLMAFVTGAVSKEVGAGTYLVEIIGGDVSYMLLPFILFLISIVIAFSTGSSWGTYAVVFPLAMPLAWSIANSGAIPAESAMLFMTICFACVMDGSVFGDQCSPVSDTTVLSSMSTGCDLMDHVKSQAPQAIFAASLACVVWFICLAFFI